MTESDPVPDPGLSDPRPRLTDVEPRARRRAKRQVAGMLSVAAMLLLAWVVLYLTSGVEAGEDGVDLGSLRMQHLGLGLTLGLALLLAGAGIVHWSHSLLDSTQIVDDGYPVAQGDVTEPVGPSY
jgi:ubiquinol-cytochrome c reductase iron-sulfur subunit